MITLGVDKYVDVALDFVDRFGNHGAKVDGAPIWESSNPEAFTVEPGADGLTARISTTGMVGTAQITARADADVDPGEERELLVTEEFEAVAAEAINGTMTIVGSPGDRP